MHRSIALFALLFLFGCDSRPEGVLTVDATGRLELQHEISWIHERMEWDVRVDCLMTGSFGHRTLMISAYDNTFRDGLFIDLQIQEFEGNGLYTRTDTQPVEALALELVDDATSTWSLNTAGGGSCAFDISNGGRVGSYDCEDVAGSVTDAYVFDDVNVSGEWLCTGLYWTDSPADNERS